MRAQIDRDRGQVGHQLALLYRVFECVESTHQATWSRFLREGQAPPRQSPARAVGERVTPPAPPPLHSAPVHSESRSERLHPRLRRAFAQRSHEDYEHAQVHPPAEVPSRWRGFPLPASFGRAAQAQPPAEHVAAWLIRPSPRLALVVRLVKARSALGTPLGLRCVSERLVNLKENRPETGPWRDRVRQHQGLRRSDTEDTLPCGSVVKIRGGDLRLSPVDGDQKRGVSPPSG